MIEGQTESKRERLTGIRRDKQKDKCGKTDGDTDIGTETDRHGRRQTEHHHNSTLKSGSLKPTEK